MNILRKDLRNGIVKVKVESADDLWYLSSIIEEGDVVGSMTERKVKIGGDQDRNKRIERKKVYLNVKAEKIEFHEHTNMLRANGTVLEGTDEVPAGSYHTINIDEGTVVSIKKDQWLKYQLEKLKEASQGSGTKVLIACHDREEAVFGLLTRKGLEEISKIKGDVQKKGIDEKQKGGFYQEIIAVLEELDTRFKPDSIVIASPGFWKEYTIEIIPDSLRGKTRTATCSTVERGLQEVVKRPEMESILKQDRTRKESQLMENVMEAIAKDKAAYGFEDCREKVSIGSVENLLVSESFMKKMRSREKYGQLEAVMKNAESMDGEVHVLSSEESMQKLDNLGGIAGILRWSA